MSEPASSEEQRTRLNLRVDEASMLSFPASDPPAIFVEEPESTRKNDSHPHGKHRAPAVSGARLDRPQELESRPSPRRA
jgi:hypothetical protein